MDIPNPWDPWLGPPRPPVPLMNLPPQFPMGMGMPFMNGIGLVPPPLMPFARPPLVSPVPPPFFNEDDNFMEDDGGPEKDGGKSGNEANNSNMNNLPPPYAGLTSESFVRQVPPNVLPQLRFPPPSPPMYGQPICNPYVVAPFIPLFAPLFEAMLKDNFDPKEKAFRKMSTEFRDIPLIDQLTQFVYCRTLSVEQVCVRWQLVMDILFILRHEFPDCEVHAFGSVLSGLGDVSSDIDIYADLLGASAAKPMPSLEALTCVKRIFKKLACPHTNRPFHTGPLLSIAKARVPLLRMTHMPSQISFDLTFENRLSAQNSRLVVLYTNIDPRVFRFMVMIRYWLKFHNLCGPNDIKNYALTLLCLGYLMRKGIVPSVHLLQTLKDTERKEQGLDNNPEEIDGWDASFCENMETIKKHFTATPVPTDFAENATEHLLKMALEFFTECANTNFGACVGVPLLGENLLKGAFIPGNEDFLQDHFKRYKDFVEKKPYAGLKIKTPLCIQDPFVLNFNVTSGTPLSSVIKFQIACAKTAEELAPKLENGDVSLLDLFIPLPNHFKNKDIHRCYKLDIKKRRLQRQIWSALGMTDKVKKLNEEEEAVTKLQNGYCQLPSHLVSMNKLMTKEDFQVWQRENNSSELMQASMQNPFWLDFFEEVNKSGMLRPFEAVDGWHVERLKLARKLAKLWRDFTTDFLQAFFENALKLQIADKMLEGISPAERLGIEQLYGLEGRTAWRIPEKKGVTPSKDASKVKELEIKLKSLEELKPEEQNYYRMMTLKVTYPFWKNRPFKLDAWKEGEMKVMTKNGVVEYKNDPIEVEGQISKNVLINYQKKVATGGKDGKENSGGDEEEQQGKKRLKTDAEQFSPFNLEVLVNINAPIGDVVEGKVTAKDVIESLERPGLTMIFQSEKKGHNYRDAIAKISSLFQTCFQDYQQRRLREWITKSQQ